MPVMTTRRCTLDYHRARPLHLAAAFVDSHNSGHAEALNMHASLSAQLRTEVYGDTVCTVKRNRTCEGTAAPAWGCEKRER